MFQPEIRFPFTENRSNETGPGQKRVVWGNHPGCGSVPPWWEDSDMKTLKTLVITTLILTFAGDAQADNVQWNRNKGDCEYVLKSPDRYTLLHCRPLLTPPIF